MNMAKLTIGHRRRNKIRGKTSFSPKKGQAYGSLDQNSPNPSLRSKSIKFDKLKIDEVDLSSSELFSKKNSPENSTPT